MMKTHMTKVIISAALCGALVCTMPVTAFAAERCTGVGTVTASALNLRSEASTSASTVASLPNGTKVIVEKTEGDWYKVNYAGQIGYVSSEFIDYAASGEAQFGAGIICGKGVNVRSGPNTNKSRVGSLNQGDVVAVIGVENDWYKISWLDKTGYVRSDYLEVSKEAASRGAAGTASSAKGSEVVAYAKQYLGVRYTYGGSSPKGFDCSGFTMYVMKHFGISLPHTATGQLSRGSSVEKSNLQQGDLVLFCDSARSNGKAASHVGIYIGNNQFIHASSGGGKVKIDSLSSSYYSKHYIGARRVLK